MTLGLAVLLAALGVTAGAQCLPVSGRDILAGDMARALPAFQLLPPELSLGNAPALGAIRTYGAAELSRMARRYGVPLEPGGEVCFLRPWEILTRASVTAALQASLPEARIELIEFSRQPVPAGELRFPRSGLPAGTAPGAPSFWRGAVRTGGQEDFPVWAKARLSVSGWRTVALAALAPGRPIRADQVRVEPYQGPPGFPDLAHVLGRAPRRPIPVNAVIESQWLEESAEVFGGQTVQLEILSGRTRVLLAGRAQVSGSTGQIVAVRNPANGRLLRGKVTGPGRVELLVDPLPAVP
jgi:flagella basal body P-ring formation protein FlgA